MSARFLKAVLFFIVLAIAAFPAFGEGQWENPEEAPDDGPAVENGNGTEQNDTDDAETESDGEEPAEEEPSKEKEEQPAEEQVEEPEPQEDGEESLENLKGLDEPELEPPEDTFPVVHANEAKSPRPRDPGRILDAVNLENLTDKLDVDRLLLSEIRKDVPEAREEAELYLIRLKELAEKSDPVRLVQLFDRVLDQATIYFKWLETEYENQDEQITEYYVGGARGFAFAMDNFRSAVFLVIMNRLDIASRVISAMDEQ